MDPSDALLGTAELAIGLIGFAGVVVALPSTAEARADDLHRIRLAGLLGSSTSALFVSLLPLAFLATGAEVSWSVFCFVQGLLLLAAAGYFVREWLRIVVGHRVFGAVAVATTSLLSLYQLTAAFTGATFQAYLTAVAWQIFIAAVIFVRMAFVSISRNRRNGG